MNAASCGLLGLSKHHAFGASSDGFIYLFLCCFKGALILQTLIYPVNSMAEIVCFLLMDDCFPDLSIFLKQSRDMLSDPFAAVRLLASSRLAQLALRMPRLCMWRGGVPLFADGEATGDFGISRGAVKKWPIGWLEVDVWWFLSHGNHARKSQMLKTWRDKR